MPDYTVVVGNIGTVHSGTNKREATLIFLTYVDRSESHRGRCADESVVLMRDGEPIREHVGLLDRSESE
jgi:hypothetical protein